MKKIFFLFCFYFIAPIQADTNHFCEIYSDDSTKITYQVEIAQTLMQKEMGLMYRTHLDQDKGMLFPFSNKQVIYMWMKNTFIPLDMLFIDENDKIVHIYKDAKPQDKSVISSKYPVLKVLEINAGESQKNKIQEGMKISCF